MALRIKGIEVRLTDCQYAALGNPEVPGMDLRIDRTRRSEILAAHSRIAFGDEPQEARGNGKMLPVR
jgi:hypothetical protein